MNGRIEEWTHGRIQDNPKKGRRGFEGISKKDGDGEEGEGGGGR